MKPILLPLACTLLVCGCIPKPVDIELYPYSSYTLYAYAPLLNQSVTASSGMIPRKTFDTTYPQAIKNPGDTVIGIVPELSDDPATENYQARPNRVNIVPNRNPGYKYQATGLLVCIPFITYHFSF